MKGALLVVALAVLPACLEPSLTTCGDLACPEGSVCVDNKVCATQEQIDACGGVAEKDTCQGPFGPGYCSSGVCVANVCGDNRVTGTEACDGGETTVTCASFGYYEGTPGCTADCVPEPGSCSGRCGDDIVQAQFGEQCDGAPPAESCLDFGRDYGVLTCNAFCAPAITQDCKRYGWEQLLPASVQYSAASANTHGVVGLNAAMIDVVWEGVASTRANTGSWTHAVANSTVLVVVGPTSVSWFDGQWHDMTAGITSATWVSVTDDGFVFGRSGTSGCTVERVELATAAKTTLPTPGQPCSHGVALAANRLYAAQGTDGVRVWDGSIWSSLVTGTASTLVQAGPQTLAAFGPTTLRLIDVSGGAPVVTTRIGAAPGIDAFDDDGNQLRLASTGDTGEEIFELRSQDVLFELPELIEDGQLGPVRTGDGRLLTYGRGVRAMRPLQASREIPSNPTISTIAPAGTGLLTCGKEVFVSGISGFASRPYSSNNGECAAVTGDSVGVHFVLSKLGTVYRYNAGSNMYETVSSGVGYTDVAGDFTQLYIASSAGILGSAAGGSIVLETAPAGCTILKLAMSANRKFVGVGACNGTLALFERNSGWKTIATTALPIPVNEPLDIAIGVDDAIVVQRGTEIYRLDGTTLTMIGTGDSVDIVTANDIFIDQGGDEMLHLTATGSQAMRIPSGPFFATPTHVFAWDRSRRSIVGIARVTGQPGGP